MAETYLFIGGSMDGEWIALPRPVSVYRAPVAPRLRLEGPATAGSPVPLESEDYHIETLRGDQDYHVYRHEGLPASGVLRRLLENYRPVDGAQ